VFRRRSLWERTFRENQGLIIGNIAGFHFRCLPFWYLEIGSRQSFLHFNSEEEMKGKLSLLWKV
jgi:hypothetical protein